MLDEDFEDRFLTINGLRLHYLDWGDPGGRLMLLLHGVSANGHHWDFLATAMRHQYRVLALDQRGHGASQEATSYGGGDFASDIVALADALSLRDMVLIGHSLGGWNAILAANLMPERVARLIVVDIGPELGRAGQERIDRLRALGAPVFDDIEAARRFVKMTEPRYSDRVLDHHFRYWLRRRPDGRLEFKCDPRLLSRRLPRRAREGLWAYLERIGCPTLIVRGMESDMLLPDIARRMQATIPDCELVELEGTAHTVPGDNPEAFEAVVRGFLDRRG